MHKLASHLRQAFRQLRTAPGFTLTVILTLALGIGATTAIFSLVEGILLRPLPFQDSERLVLLGDHIGDNIGTSVTARAVSNYPATATAFSSMGGFTGASYEISGGSTPEQVNAARLSASIFPTLGVPPVLGRVFTAQDEDARRPLAVLSYGLWSTRYHRDPAILGRSIDLDRTSYTIIGVMPRSFEFPLLPGRINQAQLWVPLSLTADELSDANAGSWNFGMVARLKDSVTLPQAAQDAERVVHLFMRTFPANMSTTVHIDGRVTPLREFTVTGVKPILATLFVAVSIVLLIACVNVAGLLLVRAIRRRREYAVRLALGARSGVIIRQSVFEGLLLSLGGGLLGLVFAAVVIRTTLHLLPESMPRIDSISLDGKVVAFALLVALFTGFLCSLAPAFAALRTNLISTLKEGARTGSASSSHSWLRSALVVSEIAIALVLLTVSGAFLRSFQQMRAVDPGFRADHVLVAGYQLPLRQYPTNASGEIFRHAVIDRLAGKPGIIAVGITNNLPASGGGAQGAYTTEGEPAANWKPRFTSFAFIYGDYFRAMSIPLIEGRAFTNRDRAGAPLVVIVNHSMATHIWPGQRVLGKRMHVGNPKKGRPWATIVGVVADTKLGSSDQPAGDQWYMPAQQPAILFGTDAPDTLTNPDFGVITLRAALPPEQMTRTLFSAVAEVDPLLALQQVQPMSEVISTIEAPRRFNTSLVTAFAIGALLLAITGIYAVVAFSISLRSQEIAIRMALGAQRTAIARLVLISGAKLALIGCALGVIGSMAISRLVNSLLFNVSATDPWIYLAAVFTMLLMALLASALPATRAASSNPVHALRSV